MVKKTTSKKNVAAKAAAAVKKAVTKSKPKASECDNCLCTEANCGCMCCS